MMVCQTINRLRIKKLKEKFKQLNLTALLVSNFYNIYYLSGFKSLTANEREAWLLVTAKNNYLLTDGRYYENIKKQISNIFIPKLITPQKNLLFHLKEIINQEKIGQIGFEAGDLRFGEYQKLKDKLTKTVKNKRASFLQFLPTEKLIIKLREIKDDKEIETIKKACQITNQCLTEIAKTIKIGQTEKGIVFKIESWLKKHGQEPAFSPIVAIDRNSSLPHYDTKTNGKEKVKKNSLILIDFGVNYQNYLSDMTRMIFVGKPATRLVNLYHLLLTSQQKTIEQLRKTNDPKKIDAFCRQQLTNHPSLTTNLPPLPERCLYPHSTGHGLGLEIHEYPKISPKSTDHLSTNQVFTIEPGIYLPERFGLRIEDTVWLKKNNQPEILTQFPKSLFII